MRGTSSGNARIAGSVQQRCDLQICKKKSELNKEKRKERKRKEEAGITLATVAVLAFLVLSVKLRERRRRRSSVEQLEERTIEKKWMPGSSWEILDHTTWFYNEREGDQGQIYERGKSSESSFFLFFPSFSPPSDLLDLRDVRCRKGFLVTAGMGHHSWNE